MTSLAAAFELFRRGLFAEAREAALAITAEEPQSFWAFYLAAVSSAFQPDLREFEKYLAELDNFSTDNVYLHYLKAYYSLVARDVEKALWHYLAITDDEAGWLARSLVKKFRKIKELKDVEFRVADFIVLPPELPPPIKLAPKKPGVTEQKKAGSRGWQFDNEKKRPRKPGVNPFDGFPYRIVFMVGFLVFAAAGILIVIRQNVQERKAIPDLQVADSAAVMPVIDQAKVLYTYRTRESIISDFEKAKTLLKERKVNQSRYLLNRLLHSNADFQTREKSRTFLGFIPDIDFPDFNDNLSLKVLFENVKLRAGSSVVLSGELRDAVEEAGGTLYRIIAREQEEEYRVHVFKNASIKEEKSAASKGKQLQVYGRFKGLVGDQKAIYLEAIRLWR